jgi:predicted DNA-binding transcriptional regulator AlpA
MNTDSRSAFSIPEFCAAHSISRALFYLLLREGRAPAVMKVGRRTLISIEAAAAWRRRMEADCLNRAG